MALNWEIQETDLELCKTKINEAIQLAGLPDFAKVVWDKNEMCVRIEKAGKSEFRLALKSESGKVKLVESKRDVSFMHKPFVPRVEGVVDNVMSKIGAKKI